MKYFYDTLMVSQSLSNKMFLWVKWLENYARRKNMTKIRYSAGLRTQQCHLTQVCFPSANSLHLT